MEPPPAAATDDAGGLRDSAIGSRNLPDLVSPKDLSDPTPYGRWTGNRDARFASNAFLAGILGDGPLPGQAPGTRSGPGVFGWPGAIGAPPFAAQGINGNATQAEIEAFGIGLEQALAAIEANLIAQVFGDALPLLGDHLGGTSGQGVEALHYVLGLKTAINNGLATLTGSATYTESQVEQAVAAALAAAGITFSGVNLDAADDGDVKLSMITGKAFAAFTAALDTGFGIPGLGLESSGSALTTLGYTMNFSVGVDAQGFYLNTANNASTFATSITTTVPGLEVNARLARLRFRLADESDTDGDAVPSTAFTGTFALDLLDPSGADNKLRPDELGNDLLNATLTGSAAINLNLATDLDTAMMPALSEDLNFFWAFSSAAVLAGDDNASFGAVPTLAFRNVTLDLGSFFTDFARPVLEEVRAVSEPLQPISDAVTRPIPLLAELHGLNAAVPQSLLEMAVATGSITQAQADRFDILAQVVRISNAIPLDVVSARIDLGDFDLAGSDPRAPTFRLADLLPRQFRIPENASSQNQRAAEFINDLATFPIIPPAAGPPGKGLTFPILTDPKTAIGLLIGRDVDLFVLDNSTQALPLYELDEKIHLVGPLFIRFQGAGDVRLDLDFGFDTRGLVQFAASDDPAEIANGFHIKVPVDTEGEPIPIAELTADFNASPAVVLGFAEVGAGGRLDADVRVTLADPNGDQRVHLDEFIERFNVAPLCVFETGGALTTGLRAYVTVGIEPLAHTWPFDYPLATIVDYSYSCLGPDDGVPVLARIETGDALLHLGPDAFRRLVGNVVDGAEDFTVTHRSGAAGNEEIGVSYLVTGGSSAAFGALPYGPVLGVIRGDGGEDDDTILLAENIVTPAFLFGGEGSDRLTGGAAADTLFGGTGRDVLAGRAGDDFLFGEDGGDLLEGGPGGDLLDGGPGYDAVTYLDSESNVLIDLSVGLKTNDAFGDLYLAIEQIEATPFNDTLIGTPAVDVFYGLDGNDVLDGRDGDDGLEGGPGEDELVGGPGFDFATYWRSRQGVQVNLATGTATGGDAEGDTLDGIEGLEGSYEPDTLTGDPDANRIFGAGGRDAIDAGAGDDFVHGGTGEDPPPPTQGIPFPKFATVDGVFQLSGMGGNDLEGGPGNDTVSFEGLESPGFFSATGFRTYGVQVNLATGILRGAAGQTTLAGFENVIGTNYADLLVGDDGPNIFQPLRGGGYFDFATSGPDAIHGGGGEDTLRIDFSLADLPDAQGVRTNATQISRSTLGNLSSIDAYSYTSVERLELTGASKDDVLYAWTAGDHDDILIGLGGDDTLGGKGGSDILTGGEGNDVISGQGTFAPGYDGQAGGHDVFDGGPGDDLVENIGFAGGLPTLKADALFHLDGGPGFDRLSVDFSNQTAAIVWDSAAPSDFEFADGAYARDFEQFRYFAGGAGDDVLTQRGRVDNQFFPGGGNDTVNPGLGVDTVDGGPGLDIAILDFSVGDTVEMAGAQGGGSANGGTWFRPLVGQPFNRPDNIFVRNFEGVRVTGTGKNDNFAGTWGDDILLGGDGDDVLDGWQGGNNRLEGGNGNDTLRGSYGINGTGANDTLLGGEGNDTLLPQSGSDTADGGAGDDSITANDFPSGGYGTDVFHGGAGDDVVSDVFFSGGNTYTNQGPSLLKLDGGEGTDTLSADFGNQTQAITFVGGQSNSAEFPDGSYFRNFERLVNFVSGSGHDRLTQPGRLDTAIGAGPGNDVVDPGLGIDFVYGGAGDDLLILDYSLGDDANLGGLVFTGTYLQRGDLVSGALIDRIYAQDFDRFHITGGSKADALLGGGGPDVLAGGPGNDALDGAGGNDVLTGGPGGANEVDRLHGGTGADTFVLGTPDGRLHDDGVPFTPGTDGYAHIDDFNPSQGDRLRLFGAAGDYHLGSSPVGGTPGTALYHDSNGNGSLDPSSDELIAILAPSAGLTLANTVGTASLVRLLDPALVDLDAIAPILLDEGSGRRFALQFSLIDPVPAGVLLEIQASTDLGLADPWRTIASLSGSGPWSGPSVVAVGTPAGGKVVVTVPALRPVRDVPRQMFRFRLSSL